jgi:predicted permease
VFDLPVSEDVRREMEFHVRSKMDELVAAGWSAEAAEAEAQRCFGDERALAAECRAIVRGQRRRVKWSERWTSVQQDVKYGGRGLARDPGFAVVAILTLALGIGANTAVFSVIAGVLLRPLPYPEGDRIVKVWELNETGRTIRVAEANYVDWRAGARSFEAMAVEASAPMTVLGGAEPVRRGVAMVGPDFFRVVAIQPSIGRVFRVEEAEPGAAGVALVSDGFWREQLGGDPNLAELELGIGRDRYQVIGVMPPGFDHPTGTDVWGPGTLDRGSSRTSHNWEVIARLRDGFELEDAQREMTAIAARIRLEYGGEVDAVDVRVRRLQEELVGSFRRPLLLLLSAATLVLLVACTNLASALLARGGARVREFAVRSSLGAERGRLLRQLLTESLLVSALGASAGLIVSVVAAKALIAAGPASLIDGARIEMNLPILVFAAVLAIGSAAVFGLFPAIRITRTSPGDALREAGRGNAGSPRSRLWGVLIAAEVALAVILLVASGLILRSFRNVMEVDPGFSIRGVATADFSLPSVLYPDEAAIRSFHDRLLPAIRALPGVEAAGFINHLPFAGMSMNGGLEIEGLGDAPGYADYRVVSDDYFASLSIPIRAGRDFDPVIDQPNARPAVIVNEAFVRSLLPAGTMMTQAIGTRIRNLRNESWFYDPEQWLTIVGVVGDVRHGGPLSVPEPETYVHSLQRPIRAGGGFVTVRGPGATGLATALRQTIRSIDSNVPVEISTLEARSADIVAERKFGMIVLGVFAGLALCLGAIGIYGVVSYAVERRRREMGVRLALGATPAAVVGKTIARSLLAVGAGLVIGLPAALASARLLRGMLFGVDIVDEMTLAVVALGLLCVGVLASWIPARRVAAIDPVGALRNE